MQPSTQDPLEKRQYQLWDIVKTLIRREDKAAIRQIIPELESLNRPILISECLHYLGDLEALKQYYKKTRNIEFFEAYFLAKRKTPFSTPPNWGLAKDTPFWDKFSSWVASKGCEVKGMEPDKIPKVITAIEQFIETSTNQRAAIAIANSGLYGGFLAKSSGIDTFVVDSHRKGNGTSYREIDDFNLRGKDVLVIDNDVATGRTLRRVIREVEKKKPRDISILLYHTPEYNSILETIFAKNYPFVFDTNNLPYSPNAIDLIEK